MHDVWVSVIKTAFKLCSFLLSFTNFKSSELFQTAADGIQFGD